MTLADLRRFAVARSLFAPVTLGGALAGMSFVQADPIRAPARAQDLILRQRVRGYRAGDLERRYHSLGIEEDFFTTYGFVTRELQALMHPRPDLRMPAEGNQSLLAGERKKERMLLAFVAERGAVHPREMEEHFAHGTVRNYWGGSSHATTQMLDALHYRGLLRVIRREKGVRVYGTARHDAAVLDGAARRARLDALVDVAVNLYGPLPGVSLSYYVRRLRYAAPQWAEEISGALQRARERLAHARIEGVDWYRPNEDNSGRADVGDVVRFLAPFDPVVHDRRRFELLWGWVYRFEAYTPASRRKRGYYALPLLWRDRAIGWANLAVRNGVLTSELGYVSGLAPRDGFSDANSQPSWSECESSLALRCSGGRSLRQMFLTTLPDHAGGHVRVGRAGIGDLPRPRGLRADYVGSVILSRRDSRGATPGVAGPGWSGRMRNFGRGGRVLAVTPRPGSSALGANDSRVLIDDCNVRGALRVKVGIGGVVGIGRVIRLRGRARAIAVLLGIVGRGIGPIVILTALVAARLRAEVSVCVRRGLVSLRGERGVHGRVRINLRGQPLLAGGQGDFAARESGFFFHQLLFFKPLLDALVNAGVQIREGGRIIFRAGRKRNSRHEPSKKEDTGRPCLGFYPPRCEIHP